MENSNNTDKKKKRILIIAIAAALVVLAVIITAGMLSRGGEGEAVEEDAAPVWGDEYLGIDPAVDKSLKDYRNFVIYGVDNNGKSDVINIFSMNKKTKEIKIVAVNRDAYLECDEDKFHKANRGFDWGGIDQGLWELNRNLDLNCREAIALDWGAVERLVDAVGGVTIDIDSSEIKYINDYINATSQSSGVKSSQITKTGKQTLDGVQAVAYSRIRYTQGGDYKRTERMRTVIEAMLSKAKTLSIGQLNKFVDTILPRISTNISSTEILGLATSVTSYNITDSMGWPYEIKGKTIDRWYGVPVTLESNVLQLHQEVFGQEDYVVNDTIKGISNQIIKKTGYK